nr:GFA family protein [Pseudomonas gingeri]
MAIYACHCRDCQTWSGSAFALHALLPEGALEVSAPLVEYAYESDGQTSRHFVCGTCHTRIYNSTSAAPGMWVLRVGTLDSSPAVAPMAHIWIKHKQPWLSLPESVPSWDESPTPEAFMQALSGMR